MPRAVSCCWKSLHMDWLPAAYHLYRPHFCPFYYRRPLRLTCCTLPAPAFSLPSYCYIQTLLPICLLPIQKKMAVLSLPLHYLYAVVPRACLFLPCLPWEVLCLSFLPVPHASWHSLAHVHTFFLVPLFFYACLLVLLYLLTPSACHLPGSQGILCLPFCLSFSPWRFSSRGVVFYCLRRRSTHTFLHHT